MTSLRLRCVLLSKGHICAYKPKSQHETCVLFRDTSERLCHTSFLAINPIPAKNILARKRGVGYLSVLLKHRTKESQNTAGLNAG